MSKRELIASGVTDLEMQESYERCRKLNSQHGKTYYLATLLLPPGKRPYVHALYGFARYADEIVDDLSSTLTNQEKSDWLGNWGNEFLRDLKRGKSDDLICKAVVDTVNRWEIPTELFEAFLHSMRMDLTVRQYQTFKDLYEYVYGSAAVIGLQMVPILEPTSQIAYERAQDLGIAFQLANFVRDVSEDLNRGRIYLPMDELAKFGVDRTYLEKRIADKNVKDALKFQIKRVKELEEKSRSGIDFLHPSSRPCIEAARILYCGIVDAVEAIDYEVFQKRAKVSIAKRLKVALPAWVQGVSARKKFGQGHVQGIATKFN
ncbi:MAG: phytoene/squalene synthase family protein [Candidatus Nanopelagicales bacterium]|jgi:15-cis-phytoene synthase|nr:phytoene/squalene synthase family protein [Candidatus Nanopelagicales bacterium]MDP4985861.1 phytoene/squalene synthase family protein [Candidatus Nanopelagicales bacterium]